MTMKNNSGRGRVMRYEFQATTTDELYPTAVEAVNLTQARIRAIRVIKKKFWRHGYPVPTDNDIDLGPHMIFER